MWVYEAHRCMDGKARSSLLIADNLFCYKLVGVKEAIGVTLLPLAAPYSPDFNPIEKVFSKLKTSRRGLALRTGNSL
jgi:hypothetical protein